MYPPEPHNGRPAGGTEQSWCSAAPGGTGLTVLVLCLSGPVDPSRILSPLRKIQSSHPILRAQLSSTAGGAEPPSYTISPSPYLQIETLDAAATAEILASCGDVASPFHRLVEHEMNRNPWAAAQPAAPLFFAAIYTVPGPTESSVVALRLHTSVCDRTSGFSVLRGLLGSLAESGDGDGERRGLMPGIEEMVAPEKASKPFWARGKDILGYSFNFTRSACLPFQDTAAPRSSEMVRLHLTAEETSKLLSACESKGVKLCGALTAAGLIAAVTSKHLGGNRSETYTVISLVDCRKCLNPALGSRDLGFYHSAVLNAHTVHGGEDLWELSRRCHSSLSSAVNGDKHLADMADLNFLMRRAIEKPHLTPSSSLRTALLSVFEEPIVYDPCEHYRRSGVVDFVGCASAHGVGPSVAIFDTVRGGRLDCACIYPAPLHSREQMEELVAHMKRILVGGGNVEDRLDFGFRSSEG